MLPATTDAPAPRSCLANVREDAGSLPRPDQLALQSKCMAAQQCAISRCVGTTVNMHKPLCNLGKVVATMLDAVRLCAGGVWLGMSRTIILVVELSLERRKKFEIDTHEEIFNAGVCNLKDAFVETTTTVAAIFGLISYETQPVPGASGERGAKTDSRYHARAVIVM